jgi:hypothetical protein
MVVAPNTLIASLIISYKATVSKHKAVWLLTDTVPGDGKTRSCPDPMSARASITRGALLNHAAELLNCAFWKVWPCFNASCPKLAYRRKPSCENIPPVLDYSSQHSQTTAESKRKPMAKARRPSFQTYVPPPMVPYQVRE